VVENEELGEPLIVVEVVENQELGEPFKEVEVGGEPLIAV